MAKLLIFVALCVLPAIVSARPARSSSLTVTGRVYCDTCLAGFETTATTYISDAKVKVECRERKTGRITYNTEGVTDHTGTYQIPVSDDHENEICETVLVSSSQNDCAKVVAGQERARVFLTRNNGIASDTRYANNLGFQKDAPLAGCDMLLKKLQEFDG